MSKELPFDVVARFPSDGDNVAIATCVLPPGTRIRHAGQCLVLPIGILEGHRFAAEAIPEGTSLRSWGLPFGIAIRDIAPGEYVCNDGMLEALGLRQLPHDLPPAANFRDNIVPHQLDEARFTPGIQVAATGQPETFLGYVRAGARGVGTRNSVVIVGVTSRTGPFARLLASRCGPMAEPYPNVDGVAPVAHTEGSGRGRPNNLDLVLRTLAGFAVHPNVGAVLIVDQAEEPIHNGLVQDFIAAAGYPIECVPHRFLTVGSDFRAALEEGTGIVRDWLPTVNAASRSSAPVSELKIALQCGGSDAFSGISGNPLVAWVARQAIRNGGSANLAETDELIGAESYVLDNVSDLDTARRFLAYIRRFKERAAWHGTSAEGNPSGGNKYRGLYNIVLKSLGAATKRHPEVRLDAAIGYAERMSDPGCYFMDSPGNDLESIAGQVASGCNIIFFVTGNGSVTNFPFVPTLKVVTTTGRYQMLANEMDVNAGAYLDGTPMPELGRRTFDLTLAVASGQPSRGEQASHSQVSIWRNWQQTDTANLDRLLSLPPPSGRAVQTVAIPSDPLPTYRAICTEKGAAVDSVGLVVPTSLCSSEVARMAAERLNARGLACPPDLTRFVALTHTEGCGVGGGPNEALYARTVLGYLRHPAVRLAVLLEHGCEKTHNDYMRHELETHGLSPSDFGWVSIQMDGGIERSIDLTAAWFGDALSDRGQAKETEESIAGITVGLMGDAQLDAATAITLSRLARRLVAEGGTVIVPDTGFLLGSEQFREDALAGQSPAPTLSHGEAPNRPGFHVMAAETHHFVETVTGLGGAGVQLVVACTAGRLEQGHPLVPVFQLAGPGAPGRDLDLVLSGDPDVDLDTLADSLAQVASRKRQVLADVVGNVDIQFTRGLLGISM